MFKSKKFSLLMALVFAFTVIMPVGVAFADDADFSQSYAYVSTDDNDVGSITVKDDASTTTDAVYVEVTLPEGVEFDDEPDSTTDLAAELTNGNFVSANSDWMRVEATDWANGVTIAFESDLALSIDDDFTGNLDVDVEAIGVNDPDQIVWTDSDTLTIAKVAGSDVDVTVGSLKKVSVGGGATVADITLEESKAGDLSDEELVYLEIETDGVSFNDIAIVRDGVGLDSVVDVDEDYDNYENGNTIAFNDDYDKALIKIDENTGAFPGELEFNIDVDIDPDVTGDIEISVTSDGDADLDESVTVATVGDVTAEVSDIDDNDTVAYAGQDTELDVEFKLATTDGSDFEADDMITFKLNNGEFVEAPTVDGDTEDPKLYDSDEGFYYTFSDSVDTDEITIKDISVILDNDAEPGDLTLTIEGDYGDLGEVTIGQVAEPFTVTSESADILAEALGQEAGDIIITETDDGAFVDGQYIYFEIPSGVELSSKPKVEVTEGSADADIADYDDDYFVVEITEESSSKPSTLRVYNIEYDTGKLALAGDVTVDVRGDIDEKMPTKDLGDGYGQNDNYKVDTKEWDFDDDSLMTTVVNATVVDQNAVTASFTVGDEGVAIKNGRTLVQVNMLTEVLGLQKSWDAANKTAYFVKDGKVVAFPIGQNAILINGTKLPVDQGGVIIDGATYATLRGIQAAFGGELTWDGETKTATFNF